MQDDDDQEDYDHKDLKDGLLLYIEKEKEDPTRSSKGKKVKKEVLGGR